MIVASRRCFALVAGGCVCGLMSLGQPSTAQDQPNQLSKYIYPLAAPIAEPVVTVDVSDNPEAQAWADEAQKLVKQWFPIAWRMLATDGVTPPAEIKLVFKKKLGPPAYAVGSSLFINGEWISQHPDDLGMMIHELTHIVQSYPPSRNKPGWLVEGIADFIRWWRYEPEAPRSRIDPLRNSYRDSYRITAAFLAWITARYDKSIVPRLDKALRTGNYTDDIFKDVTGKDLDTLWAEFAPKPAPSPSAAPLAPAQPSPQPAPASDSPPQKN